MIAKIIHLSPELKRNLTVMAAKDEKDLKNWIQDLLIKKAKTSKI